MVRKNEETGLTVDEAGSCNENRELRYDEKAESDARSQESARSDVRAVLEKCSRDSGCSTAIEDGEHPERQKSGRHPVREPVVNEDIVGRNVGAM